MGINLRKAIPFHVLSNLEEQSEIIDRAESILGNPAGFFGDDDEWKQIKHEKEIAEISQRKILKTLGFNRVQQVVDTYRQAIYAEDYKEVRFLTPILDACGVKFGINTAF